MKKFQEEFQLDAASAFTKFIHKARHLSYDALDMLMEKSEYLCSTGRLVNLRVYGVRMVYVYKNLSIVIG